MTVKENKGEIDALKLRVEELEETLKIMIQLCQILQKYDYKEHKEHMNNITDFFSK